MPPMTFRIKIGEPSQQFLQRNNLDNRSNVDRQPAGLNFYKHRWGIENPGKVYVEHGIHSFEIPYAVSITGTEDVEKIGKGIYDFSINALISQNRPTPHDEARITFITLLQTLMQAGWKRNIYYDAPRLSGEQAFRYYLEDDPHADLPINHIPTLEEWMRIKSGNWYLYAGDLFLDITMQRDKKRMNLLEPGGYLLSFSLYDKEEHGRSYFEPQKRDQWQDYWVEMIKDLKKDRYAAEEQLIKKGYTIDTDYVEPIVHPADPVEP